MKTATELKVRTDSDDIDGRRPATTADSCMSYLISNLGGTQGRTRKSDDIACLRVLGGWQPLATLRSQARVNIRAGLSGAPWW